jgi:hypothetical protein
LDGITGHAREFQELVRHFGHSASLTRDQLQEALPFLVQGQAVLLKENAGKRVHGPQWGAQIVND